MCYKFFQIYQKRTPTFLAEIVILVGSLLMILKQSSLQCAIQQNLTRFYRIIFSLSVVELLLKLIIFAVIYGRNREIANTYNTVVLISIALVHLGLWIYSIILMSNQQFSVCSLRDQFFLKCYVFIYGAMIVGGVFFVIVLIIPAIGVTFMALSNIKKEKEAQQEEDGN